MSRPTTPEYQELSGQLGRYRILQMLGAGGMGAVYLAEDIQLGRKIALKVPHFSASDGPVVIERFHREACIAASIDHPYCCQVHDVGEINGIHFFTMPYIEGTPLSELIQRDKPWPMVQAADLVQKVALAGSLLHQ